MLLQKKVSHHYVILSTSKTGKARAAIRRYWQNRSDEKSFKKEKIYNSTLIIDLPHKPTRMLGEISTLIGINNSNIINDELIKKNPVIYTIFI